MVPDYFYYLYFIYAALDTLLKSKIMGISSGIIIYTCFALAIAYLLKNLPKRSRILPFISFLLTIPVLIYSIIDKPHIPIDQPNNALNNMFIHKLYNILFLVSPISFIFLFITICFVIPFSIQQLAKTQNSKQISDIGLLYLLGFGLTIFPFISFIPTIGVLITNYPLNLTYLAFIIIGCSVIHIKIPKSIIPKKILLCMTGVSILSTALLILFNPNLMYIYSLLAYTTVLAFYWLVLKRQSNIQNMSLSISSKRLLLDVLIILIIPLVICVLSIYYNINARLLLYFYTFSFIYYFMALNRTIKLIKKIR